MIAGLAELTDAQTALIVALDRGAVEDIESATRAIGAALARVKGTAAWHATPEARLAVRHALQLVDAAAIRTNFLADQAQRRLAMVMRARGDAPRIGYTRMAQGLA